MISDVRGTRKLARLPDLRHVAAGQDGEKAGHDEIKLVKAGRNGAMIPRWSAEIETNF